MSKFHKFVIQSVEKLTAQSVVITFDVSDQLKDNFSFKAGQYITLQTILEGKTIRRDYSICTAANSNTLAVAIKTIKDGTFSVYANTQLKAGDTIEVAEPNGRFVFEHNAALTRTIAAFAAGSGITPVISIAKTLLENEPFSNFILIYGNKKKEDTMFYNEIETLKTTFGNRFHVHYVYSQARDADALFGRIDKSIVNLIVKNKYKAISIEAFYLCGPEGMIATVKDALLQNNVKTSQILSELFTTSTQNSLTPSTTKTFDKTKIDVIVDDENFTFEMPSDGFILEETLKQDIDAPYSCQGGICSSCIARVKEGQAKMQQNNILTDNEVAEGLILTCQAQPTTPSIIIDYDDV